RPRSGARRCGAASSPPTASPPSSAAIPTPAPSRRREPRARPPRPSQGPSPSPSPRGLASQTTKAPRGERLVSATARAAAAICCYFFPPMDFEYPHGLDKEAARARLEALGDYLGNRHGIKLEWAGDTGSFAGKYLVVNIQGQLTITESKILVSGKDPGL